MAIRAGELDLPAVVGTGEKLYDALLKAKMVEIDAPKIQKARKGNVYKQKVRD